MQNWNPADCSDLKLSDLLPQLSLHGLPQHLCCLRLCILVVHVRPLQLSPGPETDKLELPEEERKEKSKRHDRNLCTRQQPETCCQAFVYTGDCMQK